MGLAPRSTGQSENRRGSEGAAWDRSPLEGPERGLLFGWAVAGQRETFLAPTPGRGSAVAQPWAPRLLSP